MRRFTSKLAPLMASIGLLVLTTPAARAGLELAACRVELVDGRQIEGRFAHETDEHLIVYSPRLATLRSLPKACVHAMTVDGGRRELAAERKLTDGETELLGRIDWPDEPVEQGRTPAYASEKWDPPGRLMIWKTPGKSGVLHDPGNWIVVGGDEEQLWPPADRINPRNLNVSWLDTRTDLLLPASSKSYRAQFSLRPAGIIECRHVTVERNAAFRPSTVPSMTGNLWVARGGAYHSRYTTALKGAKHTFFLNDQPPLTSESPGTKKVRGGHIIPREGPYGMAQYLTTRKSDGASVEFIGTVTSNDDFQIVSGITVVAEGSQLWPGTRSTQQIRPDATLRLMSGAEYGKAHNAIGSGYAGGTGAYGRGIDLVVAGRIEAGTKEHPITEDVRLGLSFKSAPGYRGREKREPSMVLGPGAEVVVHTADADKARLVIRWHGRHNAWFESRLEGYKQLPELISVGVAEGVKLAHVRFEDLAKDGLLLADPDVTEQWRDVTFTGGRKDELIATWPEEDRKAVLSSKMFRRLSASGN